MSKRNPASRKTRQSSSINIARSPVSNRRITVTRRFKVSKPSPSPGPGIRIRAWLGQAIQRLTKRFFRRRTTRRKLQLLEIQQLGEKRFVAIVRVGKQRFLIGSAATSVALLAEITPHTTPAIASRPLGQESA
jgi:hypothetical protein